MTHQPVTLGEKLARSEPGASGTLLRARLHKVLHVSLDLFLLSAFCALPLWWYLARPDTDPYVMLAILALLVAFWIFLHFGLRFRRPHSLLADDRQGFMRDLRLDAKTAIFDGSNIYHLGRKKRLFAQPLREIVHRLRGEGYRVVCFFDANIFFTLMDHGVLPKLRRHSPLLLETVFGLRADEIYLVPSGVRADIYIMETLRHLPISFAVTNDRFRDYAEVFPTVMRDDQWRKGVTVSKNEIRLLGHQFAHPIRLEPTDGDPP